MGRAKKILSWGLALGILGGSACSGTPTPKPPLVTVYDTGTPLPLITPVFPSPPAGGAATETPVANNAATAAPGNGETPAATPASYGPEAFPENVNPLTGEVVDPAKLKRIPVAVKISNFPTNVRPQFGLGVADIVFEHLAEQGLTRFTAIFLQNDATKAGSVRSARYIDTELAPLFQALLVTSGSSLGTMDHLRSNAWFAGANVWRLISESTRYSQCPPLCHETPNDMNTLFTSTEGARAAAAERGGEVYQRADLRGLSFAAAPPGGGMPLTTIEETFSAAAHVSWRYNPGSGRYDRWQDKETGEMQAHFDALTNTPISVANVVLLNVNHQNNFVPEDFREGGTCGLEIQLWLSGPAKVFRDGQMFEGRWRRDESSQMHLRLETYDGKIIPLKPGNTWFGLVTLNAVSAVNGATFTVLNKVPDTRSLCPVPPTETPTATPEGWVDPNVTPQP